jgi:hypothetical protein
LVQQFHECFCEEYPEAANDPIIASQKAAAYN